MCMQQAHEARAEAVAVQERDSDIAAMAHTQARRSLHLPRPTPSARLASFSHSVAHVCPLHLPLPSRQPLLSLAPVHRTCRQPAA